MTAAGRRVNTQWPESMPLRRPASARRARYRSDMADATRPEPPRRRARAPRRRPSSSSRATRSWPIRPSSAPRTGSPWRTRPTRSWSSARRDPRVYAACIVLAPHRLDVNHAVKARLGTRKASFAERRRDPRAHRHGDRRRHPVRPPAELPVLVDAAVMARPRIVLGGGSRSWKVIAAPSILLALPERDGRRGPGRVGRPPRFRLAAGRSQAGPITTSRSATSAARNATSASPSSQERPAHRPSRGG